MFHCESVGIFRSCAEVVEIGGSEAVGHLEAHSEKEGEDEEDAHLSLFKQRECAESEGIDDRAFLYVLVHRAVRQCESVESEEDTPYRREIKLHVAVFVSREVDDPHRGDETDGAEHADGRVVLVY